MFEYRHDPAAIEYDDRREFRQGFFLIFDTLWEIINLRNKKYHIQDGLFITDIPSFNETVVREGLLNAVSHRDYTRPGSVFIRQYPDYVQILSPGGLPDGVTPDNILVKQSPRNRLIAESFSRCGLVERSGQGFDQMYRLSIQESKPLPDISASDQSEVRLVLQGTVKDPNFVRFLNKITEEKQQRFTLDDLRVLDYVHDKRPIPHELKERAAKLRKVAVLEMAGYGKGARYVLSHRYYELTGMSGTYTREIGLDTEQNKELILKHLRRVGSGGITDFEAVLSLKSRNQIHRLLAALRKEGKITFVGSRKFGRWELNRDNL